MREIQVDELNKYFKHEYNGSFVASKLNKDTIRIMYMNENFLDIGENWYFEDDYFVKTYGSSDSNQQEKDFVSYNFIAMVIDIMKGV